MEIQIGTPLYPARLASIDKPPVKLYCAGDVGLLSQPKLIAVVGSRHPTAYGLEATRHIVRGLVGEGWVVVSGLAEGIDGAAHREAIAAGGRTIAVVGSGLDVVYPPTHEELWRRIAAEHCLITEYPAGTPPNAGQFPQRNRILSGLAMGVVVIEAAEKSGALITAQLALQQGREVFAVPGPIFSKTSCGTNSLISQGAKLVRNAGDIVGEFVWNVGRLRANADGVSESQDRSDMTSDQKVIYSLLEGLPLSVDEIAERTHLEIESLSVLLTELELLGKIRREAGNIFSNIP